MSDIKTLQIWDIHMGDYRDIQQEDIDEFVRLKVDYAELRLSMLKLADDLRNILEILHQHE